MPTTKKKTISKPNNNNKSLNLLESILSGKGNSEIKRYFNSLSPAQLRKIAKNGY